MLVLREPSLMNADPCLGIGVFALEGSRVNIKFLMGGADDEDGEE